MPALSKPNLRVFGGGLHTVLRKRQARLELCYQKVPEELPSVSTYSDIQKADFRFTGPPQYQAAPTGLTGIDHLSDPFRRPRMAQEACVCLSAAFIIAPG